jgi:molybdate transport system regulatory protein
VLRCDNMTKQNLPSEIELRLRIMRGGSIIFGPGRADLLALIQTHGSIAAAGREMGMSYKRAWALVDSMNTTFASPLVEAVKGGTGGGGAKLTEVGIDILTAYRSLERTSREAAAAPLAVLQSALPVSQQQKSG